MEVNQSRRTVLKSLGIGGSAALVGGGATGTVVADDERAYVRVVHGSPDAPAVDVFVNGNRVLEHVVFGTISDYLELDPGEYTFEVAPAGRGRDAAVIRTTASVSAGTFSTVAAVGTLDEIRAKIVADNTTRLRAIHFVPDAPAVDIAVVDGPVLFEGVAFGDVTDYLTVSPGRFDIEVRLSETGEGVSRFIDVPLEPSTTYSAFALGSVSGIGDRQFRLQLKADEADE